MYILISILFICIAIWIYVEVKDIELALDHTVVFLLLWLFGGMSFFALLCLPLGRFSDRQFIYEVQELKQTLQEQRRSGSLENAAITQKIMEYNKDIASLKYNRTVFFIRDYTAPQVDTLTYIK